MINGKPENSRAFEAPLNFIEVFLPNNTDNCHKMMVTIRAAEWEGQRWQFAPGP